GGGGGYSATVIRPAIMIAAEAAISAAHRTRTRKALCRARGRSGQANNPETSANHPFVNGSGPRRNRSRKPPTPASNVQLHAAMTASRRTDLTRELADIACGRRTAPIPPFEERTQVFQHVAGAGSTRRTLLRDGSRRHGSDVRSVGGRGKVV